MAWKRTPFTVTSTGDHEQWRPTITALEGGGFAVAWQDYRYWAVIQGNVFSADGAPTDSFTVTGTGDAHQYRPTRTHPGSAAATKTPTACCASTYPRAPISASRAGPNSMILRGF